MKAKGPEAQKTFQSVVPHCKLRLRSEILMSNPMIQNFVHRIDHTVRRHVPNAVAHSCTGNLKQCEQSLGNARKFLTGM
eukprot:764554-Hanusia_phi.AAC.6